MKNIFITGGSGFFGSHLRIFGQLRFKVTALIEYNSFHDWWMVKRA